MKKLIAAFAAAGLIGAIACAQEDAPAPEKTIDASASAVFAGGCFWCMEADFEKLEGVGDVISGYAGGLKQNPTYEDHEGHLEVVRVPYDCCLPMVFQGDAAARALR